MALLPLVIKVKVSTKKPLGWADREYELPFSLNLMPRFGGSIKIQYSHPVSECVKVVSASTYPWIKPNCHRGNTKDPKRAAAEETVLPDNKRFSGVAGMRCKGAGCAYDSDQDVKILDGGRKLRISITCDGESANYEYWADVEELRPTRTETAEIEKDFRFGEYLTIEVPLGTDYWTVSGKTSTLQRISLVNKQSGPILEFKDSATSGNFIRIIYFAKEPQS